MDETRTAELPRTAAEADSSGHTKTPSVSVVPKKGKKKAACCCTKC